ncbi:MAG: cation:proton antiporter [Planctomycetota bacterium]
MSDTLIAISLIFALGALAQWVATRIRVPSILLLLATGLLAGPGMRWLFPDRLLSIRPDELLGDLLTPLAALSVGIILYEGGLTLRFRELRTGTAVIRNLVTIGAAVTAVLAALGSRYLLGLPWELAAVFGAILTVSGPTVVLPLVRHIRPRGATGPILRWEGIVIDPIGALLAVLVFETVKAGSGAAAAQDIFYGVLYTIVVGGGLGLLAGWLMAAGIRGYFIPESLHNQVSLAVAILAFALSELAQKESGLLATTVMGMYLANQRSASVEHILEFKENLRVLLISTLFVVLAARLEVADIQNLGWSSAVFVGFLILIVRPAAVACSTIGSKLKFRERVFLASMAPRGIVAAAIAPVLAFELSSVYPEAERLVPLMFAVIIGTVSVYAVVSPLTAKLVALADGNPQGVLIVGGHPWARSIGSTLQEAGIRAMVVDSNYSNTAAAWMEGVPAHHGNVLSESSLENMELSGLGRMIAVTANDQVNTLASQRMTRYFERVNVYQLAPKSRSAAEATGDDRAEVELGGRLLGSPGVTYSRIAALWARGGGVVMTPLSSAYTLEAFAADHGSDAVPLFVVSSSGRLTVLAPTQPVPSPRGAMLISIVANAEAVRSMQRARDLLEVDEPADPAAAVRSTITGDTDRRHDG